jgi:hypothetical protein
VQTSKRQRDFGITRREKRTEDIDLFTIITYIQVEIRKDWSNMACPTYLPPKEKDQCS